MKIESLFVNVPTEVVNEEYYVGFFLPIFTLFKRNMGANVRLIFFPFVLCLLLVLLQSVINSQLDKSSNKCGCTCIDTDGMDSAKKCAGFNIQLWIKVLLAPFLAHQNDLLCYKCQLPSTVQ